MTTLATGTPEATSAADRAPFRTLLEQQRADCLRQRELALAETADATPDPVAVSRATTLLRTIGEIDEALERLA